MSYGFVFCAVGFVLTQAFNGAGDTWSPTWVNLGCYWLWEIPLAYLLARVGTFGAEGVFIAITVANSTLAVVAGLLVPAGRGGMRDALRDVIPRDLLFPLAPSPPLPRPAGD